MHDERPILQKSVKKVPAVKNKVFPYSFSYYLYYYRSEEKDTIYFIRDYKQPGMEGRSCFKAAFGFASFIDGGSVRGINPS